MQQHQEEIVVRPKGPPLNLTSVPKGIDEIEAVRSGA